MNTEKRMLFGYEDYTFDLSQLSNQFENIKIENASIGPLTVMSGNLSERQLKAEKVLKIVEKFVLDQKIHCAETIGQCDHVIENAYDLIYDLVEVAGYFPDEEGDDE